jgi:hypothetical protein
VHIPLQVDVGIEDSYNDDHYEEFIDQSGDALGIINDPLALSSAVKEQYL